MCFVLSLFYKSKKNTFCRFTSIIPHSERWENTPKVVNHKRRVIHKLTSSTVLQTFQVGYYFGKTIESAVCCLMTFRKDGVIVRAIDK